MATAQEFDAIELLTNDHKSVKKLFAAFQALVDGEAGSSAADKQALADQICRELTAHATIEEEIFYPAVRKAIDEDDLMDEAEVEHASAKDLIAQIEASSPGEDQFDAKVVVLGEYIAHHVKEEQNEMFPKARKKIDVNAVGAKLAKRKEELLAAASTEGAKKSGSRAPRHSPSGRPTRSA
jgi:hemerythrin-like domain-containing protein